MPFGSALAPRLITKMMAPVIRYLRSCGVSDLLRKRDRHLGSPEVLLLARQAQLHKQRCSITTIAPLAAPSLDATTAGSCKVSRFNASKLASDRGDAMVTQRDAPVVGRGDHLGQVPNGCNDRCIKPRRGGWWRPFGHSGKLQHEAGGFWLPSEEGMTSYAWNSPVSS